MTTYSIKAIGQNLSYTWIFFENDKLTKEQAEIKLKEYQTKKENFEKKGILPTITNDRGHKITITKLELIENIGAF